MASPVLAPVPTESTTVCPLCGHDESRYYFSERGHRIVSCTRCELFYIDPYPTVDEAHGHVVEFDYQGELDILGTERHFRGSQRFCDWFFPRIAPQFQGAKSFLDVGCGTGNLLCRAAQRFPDMRRCGIELNRDRAAYAASVANCPIHQMPLEDFRPGERFDVITMVNVLSHIPSFDRLFESIDALLTPSGKLILKVGERTAKVDKSARFDWGVPDHLHFLGMNTIDAICRKYSMRILLHEREPLAKQLFSRWRFLSPGRSRMRNLVKRIIAYTPGGLAAAAWYSGYGREMYSSIIVLTPDQAAG